MKNKHLAKLSAVMITMILAVNGSFAMAEENPEAAEPTVIETTVLPQAEESAPVQESAPTEVVTEPVTQTAAATPATAEVPTETTTVQETAPTDTTTQESSAETTQVQETTEVVTEETETGAAEEPEAAAQQTEETVEEENEETPTAETQETVPDEEQTETDTEEQEEAEDPKDTSEDNAEEPAEEEAEEKEEKEPAFTGNVRVEKLTTGVLYYGDTAVLQAKVTNANKDYTLRWQVKENKNLDVWTVITNNTKFILNGDTLSVKLDEKDSEREYRAVLVVKENEEENEYKSESFLFQGLTEKPEDEEAEQEVTTAEDTAEEEEAAAEETAKDIKISAVWENNDPQIGNNITFSVELNGYEESSCRIQWQHSEDNENWEDISGAYEMSYTVTATEDNCDDYWRAKITEDANE